MHIFIRQELSSDAFFNDMAMLLDPNLCFSLPNPAFNISF